MIIEITPELVLQLLSPGNEIHARVVDGIQPDQYTLAGVRINERRNVELVLQHVNDELPSEAPFVPTFQSIDCHGSREDKTHD